MRYGGASDQEPDANFHGRLLRPLSVCRTPSLSPPRARRQCFTTVCYIPSPYRVSLDAMLKNRYWTDRQTRIVRESPTILLLCIDGFSILLAFYFCYSIFRYSIFVLLFSAFPFYCHSIFCHSAVILFNAILFHIDSIFHYSSLPPL